MGLGIPTTNVPEKIHCHRLGNLTTSIPFELVIAKSI